MAHSIVAVHSIVWVHPIVVQAQRRPRGSRTRPAGGLVHGPLGFTSRGAARQGRLIHDAPRHRRWGPIDCEEE